MPKLNKSMFKITGDDFEDFVPVISALFEDGMLVTAHLGDDDKPWTATADDCDREALDGIIESIDLEGDVKISALEPNDEGADVAAGDDEEEDDGD